MILGSKEVEGKNVYSFELTEEEYNALLAGAIIRMDTASAKYEKAIFTLNFKGKERQ